MQLADHFDVLLKDTVNLSQFKLETLETKVNAIYAALTADATIGAMISGKTPQGSWAHRTIIQPQKGKEFDADFMLDMEENPDWSTSPKTYIDEVYYALKRHPKYGRMPLTRKCRCVRVSYANDMHVDIVPHVILSGWREVIVNRDENIWEDTNPQGFTDWMKKQDQIADGNLRRVIRLIKFLRDHKNSFTGTRSILLTTLLGERVSELSKMIDPSCYSNLPTALRTIVTDLDEWLQARPNRPSIADPSGSGVNFDHRWSDETYSYFRDRIHVHAAEIEDAYAEPDKDRSVQKWQALFGDGFKAPAGSGPAKFAPAAPAKETTTGRSGRAG